MGICQAATHDRVQRGAVGRRNRQRLDLGDHPVGDLAALGERVLHRERELARDDVAVGSQHVIVFAEREPRSVRFDPSGRDDRRCLAFGEGVKVGLVVIEVDRRGKYAAVNLAPLQG